MTDFLQRVSQATESNLWARSGPRRKTAAPAWM